MASDLTGVRVGIIGGDRRELEVARIFSVHGMDVRAVCLPWPDDVQYLGNRLDDVLEWADFLLAPVGGVDRFGQVAYVIVPADVPPPRLTQETLRHVRPGTPLFIGAATQALRQACASRGVTLVEFRESDEFAWRNAVPTAEGAIQLAIQHTEHTLHGSRILVLGFGRSGTVLARTLRGLGADITVCARGSVDIARAYALGVHPYRMDDLADLAADAEVVFNTIPAPVLSAEVLRRMAPGSVIIDIASAPGGTDFAAAKQLGIQAHLAPGLPGITAPRTAGRIVADTILSLWRDMHEAADL